MKRMIVLIVMLASLGCHDSDDKILPPIATSIRCRSWDGDGRPIVVSLPFDPEEQERLALCVIKNRAARRIGHRAGCFYGCPDEQED